MDVLIAWPFEPDKSSADYTSAAPRLPSPATGAAGNARCLDAMLTSETPALSLHWAPRRYDLGSGREGIAIDRIAR
jgi:hypothetical protein